MGYQTTGAEGTVTSWNAGNLGGTFYATLLSKMRSMSASVDVGCETVDVTALGDFGRRLIPGLASWTASLEGYTLTQGGTGPEIGNVGNVVFTNSTNIFIDSFTLNISADVHDISALGVAPVTAGWRAFRPGLVKWSGTLNARMDYTATPLLPAAINGAALSAVFTYGTTATATGSIQITKTSPAIRVGAITVVPLSFEGVGSLAMAGANSVFGTPTWGQTAGSGAMSTDMPEWNSAGTNYKALIVNLSSSGTQVLTGADSFWSSLSLTCGVGSATSLRVGVQGSGALSCT